MRWNFFVVVVAPTRAIHHNNRQRRTFCLFLFLEPFASFFSLEFLFEKFLPVGKLRVISEGGARDRCSLFITVIFRIDNWLGALGTKESWKEAGESLAIGNPRRTTHTHTDGRTEGQKAANGKGSEIDEYLLSRQRKRRNRSDFGRAQAL
jgi:hypothetical protein